MISKVILQVGAILAIGFLHVPGEAFELRQEVVFAKRGDQELKLDIAYHKGETMRPALICIHGGGWSGGNRASNLPIVKMVAENGYVAMTVDYRLTGAAPWPAQLEDVQAAYDWLVKNAGDYGVDPERIAVTGQSAGGHLALMLGLRSKEGVARPPVRGIFNVCGPADLRDMKQIQHARGTVEALVGGKLEDKKDVRAHASPVIYVDRTDPPVMTIHGTADKLVFFDQAKSLHAALEKAKVPNHLEAVEGAGHGLGGRRDLHNERLLKFLATYVKPPEMPLLARVDFDKGADGWMPTDENAWKVIQRDGGGSWYSLVKNSKYSPKVRSPLNISLLQTPEVGSFVLDVDLRSTNKPYGHQDLCLFFGHQDPSHFYYVHIGRNADPHANSIFLVNGKPRVSIAADRTKGTDWSGGWHRARIRRTVATGKIEVFFDDMEKPIMVAIDKTFTSGRIGVGSFDDTGDFDTIRLWGHRTEK